jgi:hypothetical protein
VAEDLTPQIVREYFAEGELRAGAPTSLHVDQALLQRNHDAEETVSLIGPPVARRPRPARVRAGRHRFGPARFAS